MNRNPVHTVAMAPNRMAEARTMSPVGPASMLSGTRTAAARPHGASVIADCRRIILVAERSCASVGLRPVPSHRKGGGDDQDRADGDGARCR
ncbi:MAG: hypothetical protein WA944_09415 [Mycobacterium sp.]